MNLGSLGAARAAEQPRIRGEAVWLALVLGGASALYLPFFRVVTWFGDEGILPHGAERILRGDRLYSDFFEFLPPGGYLLTAAWFSVTGISFGALRSLQMLLFVGCCALTYLACLKVSRNAPASAIAVLLWAVMALDIMSVHSHHWFTSVLCLGVLLTLLHWTEAPGRRLWLPALAGLLGGTAAMVTPTRGALALLAGLLAFTDLRRDWKALVIYCAAALIVPAILIGYVIALDSLHDAIQSVIIFPATRYAAIQHLPYAAGATPKDIALAFTFPLAALLFCWRLIRHPRSVGRSSALLLCAAFGLAAFLGFQVRADIFYIARAVPQLLPLLLLLLLPPIATLTRTSLGRIVLIPLAFLLFAMPALFWTIAALAAKDLSATPTPRGSMRFLAPDSPYPELINAISGLPRDETVLVYPYAPFLSFMTGRIQPAPFNVVIPSYTTPSQYAALCDAMLKSAHWAVVDRRWDAQRWRKNYPHMSDPAPQERLRFEAVLDLSFVLEGAYGPYKLLKRTPEAARPELCEGIAPGAG